MTSRPWVIDDDRYERLRLIAWWDQERLARSKVLVVGAGALGNEVLKNLALIGIGRIYVIDFDRIETSNLTRSVLFRQRDCGRSKAESAAAALADMNPDWRVIAWDADVMCDVGLGLVRDMDVVIGCLDNREARLWVNRMCWKAKVPWIDGGIQEINGVVKVFVPPDSACYECAMTENDYRLINLRYSCPLLRQEDLLAGKVPTAPTIASFVGALQTQEALKVIHGLPVQAGAALVFSGMTNQFYTTQLQRKEDCLSHDTYDEPIELPLTAAGNTAKDLFDAVRSATGATGTLTLALDRDLVVALAGVNGAGRKRVMRPLALVSMKEAKIEETGEVMRPELVHEIREDSPLAGEKLSDLSIPAYDIVRVESEEGEYFCLLAGDRGLYDVV